MGTSVSILIIDERKYTPVSCNVSLYCISVIVTLSYIYLYILQNLNYLLWTYKSLGIRPLLMGKSSENTPPRYRKLYMPRFRIPSSFI